MTNYEKIITMNVDELAEVLYSSNDDICFDNCKKDTGNKYSCKFGEGVDPKNCIKCIKNWLLSEVAK